MVNMSWERGWSGTDERYASKGEKRGDEMRWEDELSSQQELHTVTVRFLGAMLWFKHGICPSCFWRLPGACLAGPPHLSNLGAPRRRHGLRPVAEGTGNARVGLQIGCLGGWLGEIVWSKFDPNFSHFLFTILVRYFGGVGHLSDVVHVSVLFYHWNSKVQSSGARARPIHPKCRWLRHVFLFCAAEWCRVLCPGGSSLSSASWFTTWFQGEKNHWSAGYIRPKLFGSMASWEKLQNVRSSCLDLFPCCWNCCFLSGSGLSSETLQRRVRGRELPVSIRVKTEMFSFEVKVHCSFL